jgi:hypothetical protein
VCGMLPEPIFVLVTEWPKYLCDSCEAKLEPV